MSRLPKQGGDNGNWGNILNDFLVQSHNPSGTIRDGAVGSGQIQDSAVSASKLSTPVNSILASAQTAVQTVNGKSGTSVSIGVGDLSEASTAADGQALVKSTTGWVPLSVASTSDVVSGSGLAVATSGKIPAWNGAQSKWAASTFAVFADLWLTLSITDDQSAALQAACDAARLASAPLILPSRQITIRTPITLPPQVVGSPRLTRIRIAPDFIVPASGYAATAAVRNTNFKLDHDGVAADSQVIEGIDFIWARTANTGSALLGLANIKSGILRDCRFSTESTSATFQGLIDLYASVQNFTIQDCHAIVSTQATLGGSLWVRNLTNSALTDKATKNVRVVGGYFAGSTSDEVIAVYGVFGRTQRIRLESVMVEALTSPQTRQALVSTFPLSNSGVNTNARVEDVRWDNCTFSDVTGQLVGSPVRVGQTGDESNICQDIVFSGCSATVRTSQVANSQWVYRNVANGYTAPHSAIRLMNCYANTNGSGQAFAGGVTGFDVVDHLTLTGGQVSIGVGACKQVTGGRIEAYGRGAYQCESVSGVRFKINDASFGAAFYADGNSGLGSYFWRDCMIEGGQRLMTVTSGVPSTQIIVCADNVILTTAPNGTVVSTPASSAPRIRLRGNTIKGTTALTISGATVTEAAATNDLYGTLV